MPAPNTRPNRAVIVMIVIGITGALITWSLAPYLLGLFIFLMLGAAMTITVIQNKKQAPRDHCPHCNYDIRGLPPDTIKCPECGRLLTGL